MLGNSEILYHSRSKGKGMEARDWISFLSSYRRELQAESMASGWDTAVVNQQANGDGARGTVRLQSPPILWSLVGASCWPKPTEYQAIPDKEEADSGGKRIWRGKSKTSILVYIFCSSTYPLILCVDLVGSIYHFYLLMECCGTYLILWFSRLDNTQSAMAV